ncbi:MAG: hypothetical protein HY892_08700 [Deltaproteobacteria bacterium]|nr:hypothetical protein [Deltaproteobacteria bacterium]
MPLLRPGGTILLGLSLRVSDLPGLYERKCLGNDLQRHYLDLPGLWCGQVFLIPSFPEDPLRLQ